MRNRTHVFGILLIALLVLCLAPVALAQYHPDVFAIDQTVVDNIVNITRATTNQPGWMVIHADKDGKPGPVIGQTAIPAGLSANVKVQVDPAGMTEVLHAMLHVDAGEVGKYEFPDGPDMPMKDGDKIVMIPFTVTDTAASVVGVIANNAQFSTLAKAIDVAGLADTLRKQKAATIFAPTDEAFAAVPADTLKALLADQEQLTQILLYHVVPGVKAMAADVENGDVETMQGAPVTLSVADGKVMVNDANVVEADLEAVNGVVHAVDMVLMPPAAATPAAAEVATPEAAAPAELKDIVDTAVAAGTFTKLVAAVQAAGLVDALKDTGPFTVFAPTDEAFAALPEGALDKLLADPVQLANVLKYHVVPGAIKAAEIADGMNATTLEEMPLTFTLKDGGVMVNDANVVAPDIMASNGVIHVIDKVLLPPTSDEKADGATQAAAAATPAAEQTSIADVAAKSGKFNLLLTALATTGLGDALAGDGPYTLFAPTDEAFTKLPPATLFALLQDKQALKDLLLYHVVPDELTAADLAQTESVATAQGSALSITQQNGKLMVDEAAVVQPDIKAGNGIIHMIDAVLVPTAKVAAAAVEAPAPTPTLTPTPKPTDTPTKAPTATPTLTPTPKPTDTPTKAPTATPTLTPTPKPTDTPTKAPTATPTLTPTPKPTDTPTKAPTATPTMTPTPKPTDTPTPAPTATPTLTPTPKPTDTPTKAPTATPTLTPTPKPTDTPTKAPTATPTMTPTPKPTDTPTTAPTATPTMTPTPKPTDTPTKAPTATPTLTPTPKPTDTPTPAPTATPEPTATEVAAAATEATSEATATETAAAEVTTEATVEATAAITTEVTTEVTTEATAEAAAAATEVAPTTAEATETAAAAEATVEATPEAAATEQPAAMPESGGDLGSGGLTLPVVAIVLGMLASGAYVTRRRQA